MMAAVQKFTVALSLMLGISVKFSIDIYIGMCAHILSAVTNLAVMHNLRGYI